MNKDLQKAFEQLHDYSTKLSTMKINGKKIAKVWWPENYEGREMYLEADAETLLEMSATYHGDYNQYWIIEYKFTEDDDFQEVARHNPKFVAGFRWA